MFSPDPLRLGPSNRSSLGFLGSRVPTMTISLCESCGRMREIVTGRGSRFLLCELSRVDDRFVKYPGQPVLKCIGHKDLGMGKSPVSSSDVSGA
jgi:hypothetical protein